MSSIWIGGLPSPGEKVWSFDPPIPDGEYIMDADFDRLTYVLKPKNGGPAIEGRLVANAPEDPHHP